uniref:Macaca fascicularis brain cDNA, clone: QmoA-11207 n=2 Tax=Macaca TaxID=9539 RepID=I7GE60_MACFA|nr:unnamed protein product [Macaca fascicularis]
MTSSMASDSTHGSMIFTSNSFSPQEHQGSRYRCPSNNCTSMSPRTFPAPLACVNLHCSIFPC